jgi:hypothetical protein
MLLALEFAFMNMYFLAEIRTGTSAILYFIILVVASFLAVCWIAFPVIVLSKLNELLKVARQTADDAERSAAALTGVKSALNETNKALYYLVVVAGLQRAPQ